MAANAHPELDLPPSGRLEKCVARNGAQYLLGLAAWELDNVLNRPLNHKQRLMGVLCIASKGAQQSELRFVGECLREFASGKSVGRSDEQLAALIFGKARKLVRAREVYRALNCKHDHFYGLAADGLIPLARNSEQRRGPGGSAVVEWGSLVKFIGERRVA